METPVPQGAGVFVCVQSELHVAKPGVISMVSLRLGGDPNGSDEIASVGLDAAQHGAPLSAWKGSIAHAPIRLF